MTRMTRRTGPCRATRHDTPNAYRVGCACPDAREAWRLYNKRLREGRQPAGLVDITGTRRRLEALAAIGWPLHDIAARLGLPARQISNWRATTHPHIRRSRAAAVARIYDQLWDTPGPSERARGHAARAGWPVPMAWSDDTIDDPAAEPDLGRRPRSRVDDADVIHLTSFGLTRDQIADRLGVTPDSLRDILARRRKAS